MATFLDFSLLDGASSVFGFLLIFALVYGLLKFSGLFKNSDGLNAIIAVSFSIISALSPGVMKVIKVITPWYTLLMYLVIIIIIIVMIFGGLGGDLAAVKKNMGPQYRTVVTWIVIISVIIFVFGVGNVFFSGSESEYSINNGNNGEILVDSQGNVIPTGVPVDSNGSVAMSGDGVGTDAFVNSLFHPKIVGTVLFLVLAGLAVFLLGYASVKK